MDDREQKDIQKPKKTGFVGFLSMFIADDLDNVKYHVVHNIIVPSVKDALVNSFATLINGSGYRGRSNGYTNYSRNGGYSRNPYVLYQSNQPAGYVTQPTSTGPDIMDWSKWTFDSADEAEAFINELDDECLRDVKYHQVSLASAYQIKHITCPTYTFRDWGWTWNMIRMASFKRDDMTGLYYITGLCRPVNLKGGNNG